MAVGPIMLMKPSKRDQRIASLRQEAAQQEMHIRLSSFEDKPTAVYSIHVELPKSIIPWLLLKQSYTHGLHFHGPWEFQEDSDSSSKPTINNALQKELIDFLDRLPADIVGVELGKQTVGLWWKEKPNGMTVMDLKDQLKALAAIIQSK
jgi:hypothetical protein